VRSARPGRPSANQPSARAQILDALVRLLDTAPLARPSLRAVAQGAGVSPALIHYHFEDLAGLMRCLDQERAMPVLRPLLLELRTLQPDAGAALVRFLQKWTALALRHRWLTSCLLQPCAEDDDSPQGCGAVVRSAVAAAQQQGTVRPDLPDAYIALLLLSLGLMPHLAQTNLGAGLARSLPAPQDAASLTLRHLSVLQAGIARGHKPRQDSTS
jgi:TetR/AcrR family transcriptional regulator